MRSSVFPGVSIKSRQYWSTYRFSRLFSKHFLKEFPAKWCLRNERRNSILTTRHYPDLGSEANFQPIRGTTQILVVTRVISMEFLRLFLKRFSGVALWNVSCLIKPLNKLLEPMLQLFYPSATSRKGHDIETMTDVESSAQCAAMCNQHQRCLAWSYEKNNCSLKETMPLHAYSPDVTSGKSEKQAISKMPLYSFVCHRLATCQRSGFRNLGDFYLWNPRS